MTDHTETADEPTFEVALEQLEQIVRQLEDGDLGLSESLAKYEEGVGHLKRCYDALQSAERKIARLTGVNDDGTAITQPFGEDASSLEEKQATRAKRRTHQSEEPGAESDDMDTQRGLF